MTQTMDRPRVGTSPVHEPLHPLVRATCWTTMAVGALLTGHLFFGDYLIYQLSQMFSDGVPAIGPSPLEELCAETPENPMCLPPGSGR